MIHEWKKPTWTENIWMRYGTLNILIYPMFMQSKYHGWFLPQEVLWKYHNLMWKEEWLSGHGVVFIRTWKSKISMENIPNISLRNLDNILGELHQILPHTTSSRWGHKWSKQYLRRNRHTCYTEGWHNCYY